jgi:Protein of unknown function (DUF3891)
MLRHPTPEGWILIRHPDHAALAGEFATAWGNSLFRKPEPNHDVVEAVRRHDDGWAARDASPSLTRQGRPSAFSAELVGKYTAFEEIDLPEYLVVRGRAMEIVAATNPYAAILISMHTTNLLTEHADRSTIRPDELPLLDGFVEEQRNRQDALRDQLVLRGAPPVIVAGRTLIEHFRLLQACDNMSLLACVDFAGPASLLHPLPLNGGGTAEVKVLRVGPRRYKLSPWPFNRPVVETQITGRPVRGETFHDNAELQTRYAESAPVSIPVVLTE